MTLPSASVEASRLRVEATRRGCASRLCSVEPVCPSAVEALSSVESVVKLSQMLVYHMDHDLKGEHPLFIIIFRWEHLKHIC